MNASTDQEPGNAGAFERRVCVDCDAPFSISARELAWLEQRGLQPFRRCSACRVARRLADGKYDRTGFRPEGPARMTPKVRS